MPTTKSMSTDEPTTDVEHTSSDPLEPPIAPPVNSPQRRCRALWTVTVLSLLVAAGAAGFATYLWLELDDLKSSTHGELSYMSARLNDVEGDIGYVSGFDSLSDRVDDLEDSVGVVPGFDSLVDQVEDLDRQLADAERDISGVSSDVDDLWWGLRANATAISDLQECVNEYMDIVGQSGGGRYTYYYC